MRWQMIFTEAMTEATVLSALEDYHETVRDNGGEGQLTLLDHIRIENAVLFGIKHTLLTLGRREIAGK